MAKEIEMKDTRANKNGEKCPTCTKPLTKVGRTGKFRCSNPQCSVIFVRRDDGRRSKSLSRSGSRG
jgi:ssDNA-binding Zn-finger/Zn-ribbon topoisomerase 1